MIYRDGIAITSKMLDAGYRALTLGRSELDNEAEIAARVFVAMTKAQNEEADGAGAADIS